MVRETEAMSGSDVHALSMFLLNNRMNVELLRLVHEVWSQKKLVPLKALDGREVWLSIRYSEAGKHPRP